MPISKQPEYTSHKDYPGFQFEVIARYVTTIDGKNIKCMLCQVPKELNKEFKDVASPFHKLNDFYSNRVVAYYINKGTAALGNALYYSSTVDTFIDVSDLEQLINQLQSEIWEDF